MDWKPLAKPKHIVLTAVLALVAGSTLALAAGDVEAEVPAGLGAPFIVPLPAVGDHGRYEEWREVDAFVESGAPYSSYEFRWKEDRQQRNATGALVWTNVLETRHIYPSSNGQQDLNESTLLLAGSDQILALTNAFHESGVYDSTPSGTWSNSQHGLTFIGGRLWSGLPCLHHSLQGLRLDVQHPRLDGLECPWLMETLRSSSVRLASIGGSPGARDLVVVVEEQAFPSLRPALLGRMWLREGNPYPIRLESLHGDGRINSVSVLTGFDPGEKPLQGTTEPLQQGPGLELAPLQPWGLDEAGLEHPFPLSAAFAAARDDPDFSGLRDFLASHATAYVAWARHAEFRRDSTHIRWEFGVTDGQDQASFTVTRSETQPLAPLPLELTQPTASIEVEEGGNPPFNGYQPTAMPPTLPRVASLFQQWHGLAPPEFRDLGANSWAFMVSADHDGPGGEPALYLTAGHTHYEDDSTPVAGGGLAPFGTQRWVTSQVSWREDLREAQSYFQSVSESQYPGTEASPLSPDPPTTDPRTVEPTPVTAKTAWFELTPSEAAAAGLGALLVTAAYYVWPLTKSGFVGLFSRVEKERLLDNPLRQQLVQRIDSEPGIHHNALVREVGKGKGAVEHHLDKLVAGGLVLRHRGSGFTCYFPVGTDRRVMPGFQVTKSEGARQILDAMGRGVTGVRQLAAATGLSPSTVSHHLGRLRAAGLVVGDGRTGYQAVAGGPTEGAPAAA